MARDLQGKHIVVIGASGVLGQEFVTQLIQAGAQVSAIIRNADLINKEILKSYQIADVTDSTAVKNAFTALAPFDGVINATGVVSFGNISELDDLTLQRLFAINSVAPIVLLREGSLHITEGGFFVQLSGVVAQQPVAGMAAYSASKAASWGAMMAGARELRRKGVEVIDARPPHTETGLSSRPLAGVAPKLPIGLVPASVAARIIAGIIAQEKDLPVESFSV